MKKLFAVLIALGMVVSFANCNKEKDDDNNNNVKPDPQGRYHHLYNKKWYNNPDDSRGEHVFTPTDNKDSTKGRMEWVYFNGMVGQGDYHWYPSGDSLLLTMDGFASFALYFQYLTADSMGYIPSNEVQHGNLYKFSLKKPNP